jgi:hypothetical protein
MGRFPIGTGAVLLLVISIATTVAGFRDDAPDSFFAPFRWFGPCLIGAGVLLLALIIWILKD